MKGFDYAEGPGRKGNLPVSEGTLNRGIKSVLLFNLPDDPAYDDGQNAGGNIAHGHDDSGADISKVRELLQTLQYRYTGTEDKYGWLKLMMANPCLAKSVKQSHNSRIDTKEWSFQSFHLVDGTDHLLELRITAGKETADGP